jgi:hypothetical protein
MKMLFLSLLMTAIWMAARFGALLPALARRKRS